MLVGEGSMPITCAPNRVNGSHNSPAPQPISRRRKPAKQFRLLALRSNLRHAAAGIKASRGGLILCSGAILPCGSHHSSDNFENLATSAGSTVDPVAPEKVAEESACMAMNGATLLSRGDVIAEIKRRGNGRDGLKTLADATNRHVTIVQDTAEDALIDVDALDLVEAHLEGAPLDEAGLV